MHDTPDLESVFPTDLDSAEARMRRSLQLAGRPQGQDGHAPKPNPFNDRQPGARPRQRFVQDGDVPVTIVNRHRPQDGGKFGLPAADGALAAEQAARAKAERALQEANAIIHDLRTKAGHAELARREAVAGYEAQVVELATERSARQAAEAALQQALAASERKAVAAAKPDAPPVKTPRKVMVKTSPIRRLREPKPVKWWLASAKR